MVPTINCMWTGETGTGGPQAGKWGSGWEVLASR